mgnify:CR=1 FL=1
MQGEKLELIRYIIKYQDDEQQRIYEASTEDEKLEVITKLENRGIIYTVEDIDNIGHEWLDGMIFEDEKDVEKAIVAGETEWKKPPIDLEKAVAILLLELAKLKAGV